MASDREAWKSHVRALAKASRRRRIAEIKASGLSPSEILSTGRRNPLWLLAHRPPEEVPWNAAILAIDCSYESLMTDRELRSLSTQLREVYAVNRRQLRPLRISACGVGPRLRAVLSAIGAGLWLGVEITNAQPQDMFAGRDPIYMCAEAEDVLDDRAADPDAAAVFVVGGLVDHNHHKGLCHLQAVERGFRTARLPIREVQGQRPMALGRCVLTVNQASEAVIRAVQGGEEAWKQAIARVVPERHRKNDMVMRQAAQDVAQDAAATQEHDPE